MYSSKPMMRPAIFVEIDCDLYISTVAALEWLFAHRLVVAGTVINRRTLTVGGVKLGGALVTVVVFFLGLAQTANSSSSAAA